MKNVILKSLAVALSVVIVFCCLTEPLSVSAADTPDLTLVETDLSSSEVAELVAGEVAVGVILIIIGFIALTYVTLRNVDAPIQFSSEQSFFDKCQALGQYMLDHIDDNVKDVIYSVYQFVTAGNITSISSVPKLNLTTVGTFFAKIGAWLGGSLVNNINSISSGLLDTFSNFDIFNSLSTYSFSSAFSTVFNSHSTYTYSQTLGYFYYSSFSGRYDMFHIASIPSNVSSLFFSIGNGFQVFGLVDNGNSTYSLVDIPSYWGSFKYISVSSDVGFSGINAEPSLQTYSDVSYTYHSYTRMGGISSSNYLFDVTNMLTYLSTFGLSVYCTNVWYNLSDTIYLADLQLYSTDSVTTTTSSDTVTVPLSDELVLQIADVAAAAAAGTIATTKDYYDELIAGLALTITSALSGSNFTMPEGDYYIPSLDNIWKYVEYMFSTLGSWIIFAGKCIQSVTVGEGGLSWIFYGGFIFLICGGIVGKILLG